MTDRRGGDPPQAYLVEHYWPGATVSTYEAAMARVATSVGRLARGGTRVRLLHSTFVPGDEAVLAVLVAGSPDHISAAYRDAGVSCDRIVAAVATDPADTEADR